MKKYTVTVHFTERKSDTRELVVYAQSDDDARLAARMQFMDSRRDEPHVDVVRINQSKGRGGTNANKD